MTTDPRPTLGRLRARTVPVRALTPHVQDALWALFARYYADVDRPTFQRDLAAKDHVILLEDPAAGLAGFSTLQVYDRAVHGRRVVCVFSGDTVIDRAYWGQTALQRAFLAYTMRVKAAHPLTPVYWFLITKGYKTYLLLTRNFPEHWPRHDRPTPAWQAAVMDALARERFGDAWRPDLGLLRFSSPAGRLRDDVAPIDPALLAAPDVAYFAQRNPGHAHGDELVCLGHIGLDLASSYLAKLARRRLTRPRKALAVG